MLELIQMMETDKDRKNIPACHVSVRRTSAAAPCQQRLSR